jgi:error-prone DNA polymerase
MVHPYLRRRQGLETVAYPARTGGQENELTDILHKTLGVPLFQEQAMRIAMVAAEFTGEEANALRRAMATFRNLGTIQHFREMLVGRMVARGYEPAFAAACFRQIEGFGSYGFPESHAASFAVLVYISAWLKCHHPAAFTAGLLNSQPMGFYAPAQILRDAREHGVEILPVDVNFSQFDTVLEGTKLRLGFRLIDGFHAAWAERLLAARPFADLQALAAAGLSRPAMEILAEADALRSLNLPRRLALWRVAGLEAPTALFGAETRPHHTPDLPLMSQGEQVIADYRSTGFSLRAHPCALLREKLTRAKTLTCAQATSSQNNVRLRLGGIVTVRQRPGTAKGTVFITIEDETGIANLIIWPALVERFRSEIINAALLIVKGRLQRSEEGVTHLIAERLADRTSWLAGLDTPRARADELPTPRRPPGHPRAERVVRKSRDFH